jgi:hypothetical protein
MGKVICDIHGGQISPTTCNHIAQAVVERRPFSINTRLNVVDEDDLHPWKIFFCSFCAEKYGFSTEEKMSWEDSELFFDETDAQTDLACRLCFDELKLD